MRGAHLHALATSRDSADSDAPSAEEPPSGEPSDPELGLVKHDLEESAAALGPVDAKAPAEEAPSIAPSGPAELPSDVLA